MRRNQKGFTLMELMVVIVIVAILAAVAVPLYINYVRDAQRTEAKGAIGAIITAEQAYFQRYGIYLNYTDAQFAAVTTITDPAARLDCDIREAQQNWQFNVTTTAPPNANFTVVATGQGPANALAVTYILRPAQQSDPHWIDQ
jgi:prepilin-type N-terminal cleavage/methylation domain-containing protein